MNKAFEKIIERLEEELELTREAQTIECKNNDGHWTPIQGKYSGNIEMLIKSKEIVQEVAEEYKESENNEADT